jgi:hypothetical protein
MTITMSGAVEVDGPDFLNAVKAVRVHAAPNVRDGGSTYHRVRFIVGFDGFVNIVATNGYTDALAQVAIVGDDRPKPESPADGPYIIDVPPVVCARILTVIKARKPTKNDNPKEGRLELLFDDASFTVREMPGSLWPGNGLFVPLDDHEGDYPDVVDRVTRTLRLAGGDLAAKPLVTPGKRIDLFNEASGAYGAKLRVTHTGVSNAAWLVEAGDSFLGILRSSTVDDADAREFGSWRQRWLRVLPAPSGADTDPSVVDLPAKPEPAGDDTAAGQGELGEDEQL